jgi:hypothetical protein
MAEIHGAWSDWPVSGADVRWGAKKFPLVKESEVGGHVIYFKPCDWLSWEVRAGQAPVPKAKGGIRDMITNGSWASGGCFKKRSIFMFWAKNCSANHGEQKTLSRAPTLETLAHVD